MNKNTVSSNRGIGFALGAAGVSGIAVFVNGLAVRRFDDATVYTTAKNLVAGAVLAALLATTRLSRTAPDLRDVARRAWPTLAVIALVGGAVPFVLFFEGLARATSTNAAFIHKTLVIWVAIGATIVLHESLTAIHAAAIGLLVIGHLVLTGGIGAAAFGSAELLVLAATLLWAIEVLLVKRVLVAVPASVAATARMGGGSLLLIVWLGLTGHLGALMELDARQWLWVLLTGSTLAAFVTVWYHALALASAIDVTALLVLGGVVTGLLDSGLRSVPLSTDPYGYLLITLGVAAIVGRALLRPVGEQATA